MPVTENDEKFLEKKGFVFESGISGDDVVFLKQATKSSYVFSVSYHALNNEKEPWLAVCRAMFKDIAKAKGRTAEEAYSAAYKNAKAYFECGVKFLDSLEKK